MISSDLIKQIIDNELKNRNLYLVDMSISKSNNINIFIDGFEGVTIDDCAEINRIVETNLNRDKEDFALEVSSPGLNKPFKLPFQYHKNVGKTIEVIARTGEIIRGKLIEVNDDKIDLEVVEIKYSKEKKRKKEITSIVTLHFSMIKSSKVIITF